MPSDSPAVALVALSEPLLPEPERVVEAFARAGAAPDVTSRTDAAFTLAWPPGEGDPGSTANVTLVDRPIPWSKLEGPCATAWYWPDAERVMRDHTHHLFVTLLDERKHAVDRAARLTETLVALAANAPAVGFVWGSTGAVHEPKAFTELAAAATPENLPLHLWIDFRAYEREGGDGYGLFTTGMEALGRREFEVPRYLGEPNQLIGATYNIAHYAIEKDATLQDSEVIGLPDESQVTIREERSMIDPEQDVLRLEFE